MNELDEYLDSLGLPAEDRTQLATILSKAGTKATAPLLMRSDYTKKTQELAKERETLAAQTTALNAEYSKALKDLETGKVTLAQYEAKLERIGKDWGIPEEEWKAPPAGNQPQNQPQQHQPPQVDPSLLQRLEAAERNYGVAPEVNAVMQELQIEYQSLFGNLDGFRPTALLKHSRENKLPLRGERDENGNLIGAPGAFERLYKTNEKRQEQLIARIRADADKEAQDKFQQRMDQLTAGNATGERNPNSWASGSHLLTSDFKQNQAARIDQAAKDNGRTPEAPPSQSRSAAASELGGGGAMFARRFMERRAKGIGYGQDDKAA